ncbi:MAG: carotenoid biosynthesis protein [Deltaproteobacteria bacterium]|nr:carotenoid biosynthesis protein [Deltaproteobacteria bacterium]
MLALVCLLIVAGWFAVRLLWSDARARLLGEAATVSFLAWAGEQSCISWYGFYAYDPARWWVMVGSVPLTVLLIWPVVVISARDVVRVWLGERSLPVAGLTLAVVITDAAFVEASAVHAGLWSWTVPGVFGVPVIGILGWGLYGGLVAAALEQVGRRRHGWLALLAVLPALHLALLALWWGGLRWLSVPVGDAVAAAAALVIGGAGLLAALRLGGPVPIRLVTLRLPGAIFFVGLLALYPPSTPLVVWLLALSLPWLAMCLRGRRAPLSLPIG